MTYKLLKSNLLHKKITRFVTQTGGCGAIGYQFDGEELLETLLKSNKKNKIPTLFDNINTSLILNLNKIYLEKNSYLEQLDGNFDIKNKYYIIQFL